MRSKGWKTEKHKQWNKSVTNFLPLGEIVCTCSSTIYTLRRTVEEFREI